MTKHLIISSESSNLYTTKRLLIEGKKLKYNTEFSNPYNQSLLINSENIIKKNLNTDYLIRTSGIRNDDFDLIIANSYSQKGATITNPLAAIQNFRTKDLQMQFLGRNQVPIIPTLVYRGKITENLTEEILKLSIEKNYIIKMNRGNGGIGVQLLRGLDSLLSVLETFEAIKDQKLIIQPFLEHKTEYRVLIANSKILAIVEKKINPLDFRGNSKRSTGKVVKKIRNEIIEIAMKAYECSGLIYAGIDIFIYKDQINILEVNAVPGFEQIENLSTLNIAKEIILCLH